MILCNHCHKDLDISNPSGFCDHTYYPDHCSFCEHLLQQECKEHKFTCIKCGKKGGFTKVLICER